MLDVEKKDRQNLMIDNKKKYVNIGEYWRIKNDYSECLREIKYEQMKKRERIQKNIEEYCESGFRCKVIKTK